MYHDNVEKQAYTRTHIAQSRPELRNLIRHARKNDFPAFPPPQSLNSDCCGDSCGSTQRISVYDTRQRSARWTHTDVKQRAARNLRHRHNTPSVTHTRGLCAALWTSGYVNTTSPCPNPALNSVNTFSRATVQVGWSGGAGLPQLETAGNFSSGGAGFL